MKQTFTRAAAAASILCASLAIPAGNAAAQSAKSLVGSWAPVSVTATDPSGKKSDAFGTNPRGNLVFTADGRYTLIVMRDSLPKFASNSRAKGSADENQAVVAGSIGHFGKYSVDAKSKILTFQVDRSTYANWDGIPQKRPFSISKDELKYSVPAASTGGTAELVWKRVK